MTTVQTIAYLRKLIFMSLKLTNLSTAYLSIHTVGSDNIVLVGCTRDELTVGYPPKVEKNQFLIKSGFVHSVDLKWSRDV